MRHEIATSLNYWSMARQPWSSMVFILPFLLSYECAILFQLRLSEHRNGADLWMRDLGGELGWWGASIVPLLAPLVLIIWQLVTHSSWECHFETLLGMFAESVIFAMMLILAGQVLALSFPMEIAVTSPVSVEPTSRVVAFFGAGLYEEIVFRMLLIPLAFASLRILLIPRIVAGIIAILLSSWLFATAHYVESMAFFSPQELWQATIMVRDDPALWYSYAFRLFAGGVFAAIFCLRGFGIAVGSHILYDIVVGIFLANPNAS